LKSAVINNNNRPDLDWMPDSVSGSGHRGHAPALQYGRRTVALKTLGSAEQLAVTHRRTVSHIGHIVCLTVTH